MPPTEISTPTKKSIGKLATAFNAPCPRAGAHGLRVSRYNQLKIVPVNTVNTTIINIPNGTLSAGQIENISRRDAIRFYRWLPLRLSTTPDQLRYILASLRDEATSPQPSCGFHSPAEISHAQHLDW